MISYFIVFMYIKRELEETIKPYLHRKEIIAIIGPRQVGKTTLVKHLLKSFNKTNSITFEDIKTKNLFEQNIDAFIELHVKNYDYLFIDEVQYSKTSGKQLKYIYDTQKIKIIVSGSSASELSIRSLKYLVGRVLIYNLYPFSFLEYLEHKNPKLKKLLIKNNIKGLEFEFNKLLDEYILYGGYPEVVIASNEEEKELVLKNIYNTYFLKEIKEIFQLKDDYKISVLLKTLSLQISNIINYQSLSELSGLSIQEVKNKINVFEKTFLIIRSKNFHTNKRTELKKSPKIFFIDNGFRNIAINNFSKERTDQGALYENFIAQELIKKEFEIKFWRTQSKAEVDFVLEKNGKIIPIEVKTIHNKLSLGKSYISFIEQYKPKKGFLFSLNFVNERKVNNSSIYFKKLVEIINIKKLI